jgi:predicted CoA-substrate-specific enzyme activase
MLDPLALTLGLDLGSTAVKAALVDGRRRVVFTRYRRHNGQPLRVAAELLRELFANAARPVAAIALTGSAAQPLAEALGARQFNEVVALSAAVQHFHPEFRTVVEVGGTDAKIIELAEPGAASNATSAAHFRNFTMTGDCAAGTGSFLDQQAHRLGVSIDGEFGRLALRSEKPPRVAGRCSVFAKSDMIHLQQQAVPDYDIVAGLCFGMARNFKATLARGRDLQRPIAFVGGVASNAGMVRAFREVFELSATDFRVPDHHAELAAVGAALCLMQAYETAGGNDGQTPGSAATTVTASAACGGGLYNDAAPETMCGTAGQDPPCHTRQLQLNPRVLDELVANHDPPASRLASLIEPTGYLPGSLTSVPEGRVTDVYLGIDVGSISTNLVLLDAAGGLVAKLYIMTAGRPIEAVRDGLRQLGDAWSRRVRVVGVATTGSGRYLTGDIVGADVVRNEITAQARGAAHVVPDVDTIFEIGGQDSKYIRLHDGVVVDFEMNHVCAAGTGSFLEEQAERLGISIKEEFARLALSSRAPVRLGERCTVFMESDLVHHQQQGAALADLVAGLAYSIAANYLNRVVGARSIGQRILFQGGTAFNRAVTAAFAAQTGRPITVPPHHEVTGAIGAALLAREAHQQGDYAATAFRGFHLADRPYQVKSFACQGCSNYCDIRQVTVEGEAPLFYGSRCDKYNKKAAAAAANLRDSWPDLVAEREHLLLAAASDVDARLAVTYAASDEAPTRRGVIGVPRALVFHQLLPFWRTLLERLGFDVLLSPATDSAIIQAGVESVLSQTCFPVKVAHGHVRWLVNHGVDAVLLPSVLSMPRDHESQDHNHLCPYVQSLPYQVESALGLAASGVRVLSPVVELEQGYEAAERALRAWAAPLGIGNGELADAIRAAAAAQRDFEAACLARGREVLARVPDGARLAVIVSRPYNGCDRGLNLDLARRMKDVGLLAMPMDFLDLRHIDLGDDWHNLFWKYGQKIVRAGEIIASRPDVEAVYISNFGCGPDSFLRRFFQEALGHKPFLALEIDEHSAAAGLVTRLEAFVDSLRGAHGRPARSAGRVFPPSGAMDGRTLLIPHMCDHAYAFAAAFRGAGLPAAVIPPSDEESLALGRQWTSGKECLPCIVTAGDMLRELKRPGVDPLHLAFFMPSGTGPCRFGMYSKLHRLILRDAGYPDVPIVSPNQGASFYQDFKKLRRDPTRLAWQGIVAVDALTQARHAVRPYEAQTGAADAAYAECLRSVEETLEHRGDIGQTMRHCARRFTEVPRNGQVRKPLVGIVGEIYVRSHAFSNQDIVQRLELLGLEVELASFAEWIFYTNWTRLRRTRGRRQWRTWLGTVIKEKVQRADEAKIKGPLAALLRHGRESRIGDVMELANPYIHDTFEGEATLSVGKVVELAHSGAAGVVNVMPFTCMPGNIVAAVLQRLRHDLGDLPILSISYDGQRDASLGIRLEAFAEQVKAFHAARPGH